MNVKQAAEILGCSRMHIYRLIERGLLHPDPRPTIYQRRGPVRIPRAQVLALLPRQP